MGLTTPRWALRYPVLADSPDVPRDIQNLATDLDGVAMDDQGPLGSRPAAGKRGRYWFATDNGLLYRDTGTAWTTLNAAAAVDAAAGVGSLRTLGTGAQQAAAGNDSRLSDQRTPSDGSVTAPKVNAALKPSQGAGAGTEALRALGTAGTQAAAGNDSRLSDQRVPTDGSVTGAKVNATLKPSGSAGDGAEALRALGTSAGKAASGLHADQHRLSGADPITPQSAFVTSLPTTPIDGQVVAFQPISPIIWHLRYRQASAAWYFVGGQPIFDWNDPALTISPNPTDTTGYGELGTTPNITVPLAGDYQVEHGAYLGLTTPASQGGKVYQSFRVASLTTLDADAIAVAAGASHDIATSGIVSRRKNALVAGQGLRLTHKYVRSSGSAGTAVLTRFESRWIKLTPVRIDAV